MSVGFEHSNLFGERIYKTVLIAEIVLGISLYLIYYFWNKEKRHIAIALSFLITGVIFAIIGWFVYPNQTYERARDRLYDWEKVVDEYQYSPEREVASKEKDSITWRRLREELAARQLEYQAAEIRYNGEPGFFHSTFYTWSYLLFAIAFFITGVSILRGNKRNDEGKKSMKVM